MLGVTLSAGDIDEASRAAVIVFQTWIGVGDQQVMVNMKNGRVVSIDHGAAFGDLTDPSAVPKVVVADIPGIRVDTCKDMRLLDSAIQSIENLSERSLVEDVSGIPAGGAWNGAPERRLQIANWLGSRRAALRGVIKSWSQT